MTVDELLIKFGIDSSGAHKGASEVQDDLKKIETQSGSSMGAMSSHLDEGTKHTGLLSKAFGGLGGAFSVASGMMLAQAPGMVIDLAKNAMSLVTTEDAINSQTTAVLKSTGGAAHVTAAQVDELAASLSAQDGVSQEVVKSNENMLLTFTNVKNGIGAGNDIFDQATVAVQNMSQALGEDGKTASIQLGKALNDPVAGVTALQRVGVKLTATQKEQVAQMVKMGDTVGAQKVILGELTTEFGGSAKAFGDSSAGAMAKIGNDVDEAEKSFARLVLPMAEAGLQLLPPLISGAGSLATTIGSALSPVLTSLGTGFGKVIAAVTPLVKTFVSDIPGAVNSVTSAVGPLVKDVLGVLSDTFNDITSDSDSLTAVLTAIGLIVAAVVVPPMVAWAVATIAATWPIVAIVAGVAALIVILDKLGILKVIGATIKDIAAKVMPTLTEAFNTVSKAVGDFVNAAMPPLTQAFNTVMPIVKKLVETYIKVLGAEINFIATTVIPAISAAFDWLVKNVLPPVMSIVKTLIDVYIKVLGTEIGIITRTVLPALGTAFKFITDTVIPAVQTAFKTMGDVIGTVWTGISSGVKTAINIVIGAIDAIIGGINAVQLHIHLDPPIGPHLDFDYNGPHIGTIKYLAAGTNDWSGGPAVVGENGPELLNIPKGSTVTPAAQTAELLKGGTKTVNNYVTINNPIPEKSPDSTRRVLSSLVATGHM